MIALLVDNEAWARAGEELKQRDPQRYLAILTVVQDIIGIHRDPIRYECQAKGNFVFGKGKVQS